MRKRDVQYLCHLYGNLLIVLELVIDYHKLNLLLFCRSARARQLLARLESGAVSSCVSTARSCSAARTAGPVSSAATSARSEQSYGGQYSMMDETADMIRQAENIIGDDASMKGDINRFVL